MNRVRLVRCLRIVGATILGLTIASGAAAQYPDKPVRFVVPVGTGGGTDIVARLVGKRLSDLWGQPVVVENKPGGGGIIGSETVIRAPADGYTLLFTHGAVITATPALYNRPDFDPTKQLAPVTQVAANPLLVVVNASVPVSSMSELVALMKEKKAKGESFGFATSALGSADHLAGEEFRMAAKVEMLVVPYKNAAPALADVVAGHAPFGFFTIPVSQQHVKAGTVRALGITSANRSKLFPDLPTLNELYPGLVTGAWYGIWAPAGTPAAIVEKISSDTKRVLDTPEMTAYFVNNGLEAVLSTPADFREFIRKDTAKTVQVIKNTNVRLE